jgi:hypothetical protein
MGKHEECFFLMGIFLFDNKSKPAAENYKELVKFYFEVKELITAAERDDIEQRLSISAITELRAAFDHIMRAHSVEYNVIPHDEKVEITGLDSDEYCRKNYNKAYAHLYRGGYDAYDCISISMIDYIDRILNGVSRTALYTVIPNASNNIVKPYQTAKTLFTNAKVQKDVENHEQEKKQFDIYEKANKDLLDIKTLLQNYEEEMITFDKEVSKKTTRQRLFVIFVSACSLIIGIIIRSFIKF